MATNALLERRGGRVALVTTAGHRDVIEIARQARPSLYDPWADRPEPLVPRHLRFEVAGRLDAQGKEVTPLGRARRSPPASTRWPSACSTPTAIRTTSRRWRRRSPDKRWCAPATVSPEYRDYERTVTTVVDAYLRRPCRVLPRRPPIRGPGGPGHDLGRRLGALWTRSPGGPSPCCCRVRPAACWRRRPPRSAAGFADCVTLDMGGTSTDVCLIRGGRPGAGGPAPGRRAADPDAVAGRAHHRGGRWLHRRASTRAAP